MMQSLLHTDDMRDVERRLNTLQPDCVARWGRMSSHQAVCHLSDAFRVALGERTTGASAINCWRPVPNPPTC